MGCITTIAVIISILVAGYFALSKNADFPGANTIRTFATEAEDAYKYVKDTDITGNLSGFHDTKDERADIASPSQRHLQLKELMIKLTNQHRAAAGVPPIRLGSNPAAQLHAEAALEGCYSSHWDQWGLKPNHRYTLTGGTGAEGENVSGSDYCVKPHENYVSISDMAQEIAETVQGWMDSPGHRRNLLNPAHTILNVGIAHDRFNQVMVQQFSSDYVTYTTKPSVDSEGVLRLKGSVAGATLSISNAVNIVVAYDPPAKTLTRGQLAYTYALCNPKTVAYLVQQLPPGWFHSDDETRTNLHITSCVDPYQTPPSRPAPNNNAEAHEAWAYAKAASAESLAFPTQEVRITSELMDITNSKFNIRADLTPVLREHGPGIYTITIWGRPEHMAEPTPLSEQSIFWLTPTPEGAPYTAHQGTQATPTGSATPSPPTAALSPTRQTPTDFPGLPPTAPPPMNLPTFAPLIPGAPVFTTAPTPLPTQPTPPVPTTTPTPYQRSKSLKPEEIDRLFQQNQLTSGQQYATKGCYIDPRQAKHPRRWTLFSQPGLSLLKPVFTIHFAEPVNIQHGTCYEFNVSFMGPTEWRACASQPYGGNCERDSVDFLWEREIPAFRGSPDSATHLWSPPQTTHSPTTHPNIKITPPRPVHDAAYADP